MPVRSLSSSVLSWPDRRSVDAAARRWAESAAPAHPGTLAIGYFGSYARGDAGVGSDLDLLVVVDEAALPFFERPLEWSLAGLPVPAEALIYTVDEWRRLAEEGTRFARVLLDETVWVWGERPAV